VIETARVYTHPDGGRGFRLLVDRLWPRGIKKDEVDLWLKEVAPSDALREWYGHEPGKWEEFKKRYFAALEGHPGEVEKILEIESGRDVLLLYGSREERLNNATALKEYLEKRGGGQAVSRRVD